MKNKPMKIGDKVIQPGERMTIGLPTPEFYSYASLYMPIHIIHGKKAGPCLVITSAMHGDEMNGISIIHKLLELSQLKSLQGTLICVPVVNVYGLISLTRNLPDKRDLDGSFPGYEKGSFAARLAHYFNQEILSKATHAIDIHSAFTHEMSLSQVQTDLSFKEAKDLALSFQPPVIIDNKTDRGLLWQNHHDNKIPTIIFETGEPLRLDPLAIRLGVRGIMRVMRGLGMVSSKAKSKPFQPIMVNETLRVRSPSSGICQLHKKLGFFVKKGSTIATIFDPFGTAKKTEVISPVDGIIVNKNTLPLINEGDYIVQIAETGIESSAKIEDWKENYSALEEGS